MRSDEIVLTRSADDHDRAVATLNAFTKRVLQENSSMYSLAV